VRVCVCAFARGVGGWWCGTTTPTCCGVCLVVLLGVAKVVNCVSSTDLMRRASLSNWNSTSQVVLQTPSGPVGQTSFLLVWLVDTLYFRSGAQDKRVEMRSLILCLASRSPAGGWRSLGRGRLATYIPERHHGGICIKATTIGATSTPRPVAIQSHVWSLPFQTVLVMHKDDMAFC
jgi:hypothetical protein